MLEMLYPVHTGLSHPFSTIIKASWVRQEQESSLSSNTSLHQSCLNAQPSLPYLFTSTEFSLEKTYFSHFLSLLPQSSQDDRCCLPTWHPFTFLLVKASGFPLMSYPLWSTRFSAHWPHTTHHHRDEWKIKTWPSRVMGTGPGMEMERGSALWILVELPERMCCGC